MRFDWPGSWTADLPDNDQTVGVVAAHDFPEPDLLVEVIQSGLEREGKIVWVAKERDSIVKSSLERCGIVPVLAKLNPYWKGETYDRRDDVRVSEMLNRCDRVLVFTTPTNKTLADFLDPLWSKKVKVITRGAALTKHPYRKGKARD